MSIVRCQVPSLGVEHHSVWRRKLARADSELCEEPRDISAFSRPPQLMPSVIERNFASASTAGEARLVHLKLPNELSASIKAYGMQALRPVSTKRLKKGRCKWAHRIRCRRDLQTGAVLAAGRSGWISAGLRHEGDRGKHYIRTSNQYGFRVTHLASGASSAGFLVPRPVVTTTFQSQNFLFLPFRRAAPTHSS